MFAASSNRRRMSDPKEHGGYVSTRELAAELKSMRWEMRFLIALAGVANLGIAKALHVPGVEQAVGVITNHL